MKEITILGKVFQYNPYYFNDDFWGGWRTNFYDGTIKKKSDSWYWKGISEIPLFAFSVTFNIEFQEFSKSELKKILEQKTIAYFNKLNRDKEIMKGELI